VTRGIVTLVLACGLGAVAASCFPSTLPPCTQREQLETRYVGELVAGCADAGSLAACPDFAAIKARHNARMKEASCRY
jgi:hypothetical protein